MLGLRPSVVVLPKETASATDTLLRAHRALDGSTLECQLVPLSPGEEVMLPGKLVVRPFQTVHRVPSQGYIVYSRRRKLKPEFVGQPSDVIKDLKKSKQEVMDEVEVPEVAFTGDTTVEFLTLDGCADALRARLLILELTFLDDDVTLQHAQETGHMHIQQFIENADKFQNEAILLIHFSQRYSAERILQLLDAKLPKELRNKCTPLLTGFR